MQPNQFVLKDHFSYFACYKKSSNRHHLVSLSLFESFIFHLLILSLSQLRWSRRISTRVPSYIYDYASFNFLSVKETRSDQFSYSSPPLHRCEWRSLSHESISQRHWSISRLYVCSVETRDVPVDFISRILCSIFKSRQSEIVSEDEGKERLFHHFEIMTLRLFWLVSLARELYTLLFISWSDFTILLSRLELKSG